jgi:hypothetical protein
MPSPGQMNFAAIIGGLTRGLSEGLSFKRKYEMDMARQQGMAKYRQEQLGMQKKRLEFEERRAEIAEEDAAYKKSIRETPEEVKRRRKLEDDFQEKRTKILGQPTPLDRFSKTLKIGQFYQANIGSAQKSIDNINDKLDNMQALLKSYQMQPKVNKLQIEQTTNEIMQLNSRKKKAENIVDQNRVKLQKISLNEDFRENANPDQKQAQRAGIKMGNHTFTKDQVTDYVRAINSANPKQLDEIYQNLLTNNVIGPNVPGEGFQTAEALKKLISNRAKQLQGRGDSTFVGLMNQ